MKTSENKITRNLDADAKVSVKDFIAPSEVATSCARSEYLIFHRETMLYHFGE